ncbi:hypothetical protein [uncultured Duncaniella sp.]|uniref:hypothetical protein n=1 Tax=uncultured Duncaniella sp. TaxID=2768039 RepID=UPI0025E4CA59|nr:hypothetical protein [uncultured Duncaniella sp.]
MKKILLPAIAACVCVAPAFGQVYGTTPETAKPFPAAGGWFVPNLEDAPSEAWFKITSPQATPALWGDAPSDYTNPVPAGQQIFVYLCEGGQQAFQMNEGSDAYVLMPGQEYLVKITPKVAGFFGMSPANPLPASRFEGKEKYYPISVSSEEFGQTRTIAAGETQWFELTVPYATQITTNYMMAPVLAVEKIEAIHIDCHGATNTGSGLMGPYVKAGKNVVGFTASADAAATFQIGYNAMLTLNCGNNLLRGQSLTIDAKNTYPDAYYTVDRYFTVPEDGTYTFINHGAKGTILSIGKIKLTDPENQYAYECDWNDIKDATVGNEDATIVVNDLVAGEKVLVQSDAFGVIGEGPDNLPYLMVVKGDVSGIDEIAADNNGLKVNASNGRLRVESVLLASGAEVAVYDTMARKVASAVAAEGSENLEMNLDVASGVYVVVVYGKGNSESAKISVK